MKTPNENENSIFHLNADSASILKMRLPKKWRRCVVCWTKRERERHTQLPPIIPHSKRLPWSQQSHIVVDSKEMQAAAWHTPGRGKRGNPLAQFNNFDSPFGFAVNGQSLKWKYCKEHTHTYRNHRQLDWGVCVCVLVCVRKLKHSMAISFWTFLIYATVFNIWSIWPTRFFCISI